MIDLSRLPRMTAAARSRLRDVAAGKAEGYLIEGLKTVVDALRRAEVPVREVWIAENLKAGALQELAAATASRVVSIGVGTAKDLESASGTVSPQGVLARVDDVARPLEAILASRADPILLLDGIQDPGNVGAIFRVAAAFSMGAVLVSEGTADPMGSKALRASVGSALVVPFTRGSAADFVAGIERSGRTLWCLDTGGDDLWSVTERPQGLVLAVGNEGRGLREEIRAGAARRIGIPISSAVESLNAAVAVGIAVAHLSRFPAPRPVATPPKTAGKRR